MKFRLSSFCIHTEEQRDSIKKRLTALNTDGSQNGMTFVSFIKKSKDVVYFKDGEFKLMDNLEAAEKWELWKYPKPVYWSREMK